MMVNKLTDLEKSVKPIVICIKTENQAEEMLREMDVSPEGIKIMRHKAVHRVVKVSGIDVRAASIMKQEMLSKGGEVAAPWVLYKLEPGKTDVVVMGTHRQFEDLLEKLKQQPFGLKKIGEEIRQALSNYERSAGIIKAGRFELDLTARTQVMGIVNVTPDSFSDGGRFDSTDSAVKHAKQLIDDGADVLDIGGESTRPGAGIVDIDEELRRTIPVIERLAGEVNVPISIDTYKPEVASRALAAGATIINDISGLSNEGMVELAVTSSLPVIVMHMQGAPRNMQDNPEYDDVVFEVCQWLADRTDKLIAAGIKKENIMIDPGIGFGKNFNHNLEILNRLAEFKSLGYPLVLGTSRKAFIGAILDAPADDRVEGTIATVLHGVEQGAGIVRVHDVRQVSRACRVMDAVKRRSV
jgi:dihydropteroate synthase